MTTPLPPSADFTGAAVTEGGFKTAITSLRAFLADLLGASGTGLDGALLAAPRRVTFGGTADAVTATLAPAITAYTTGMRVTGLLPGANTVTAPTLNLNAFGTKTIKKRSGSGAKVALVVGDTNATLPFGLEYDGTDFVLLNPLKGLSATETAALAAGYSATPYNAGTKSSGTFTPDEANGNMQYCVNGGAFTLAPPTNNCTLIIQITNNASAGAITTSGFTKVTGTAPTTTNGDDFLGYVTKINGFSHLAWQALQ